MKTLFLIGLIAISITHLYSQDLNYKFRIRYGNYTPLANKVFIISGYRLSTDPQGIINLKFSERINYVNIETDGKNTYEIKYPLEGRAILPKDPNTFIDIYIEKPAPDPLKQIKAEIRSSQSSMQSAIISKLEDESRKAYNGIVELLNSKNINEAQLTKGQLEFFPLISTTLNNYLNEARNFNDALFALSNSLNNASSYEQLNNAIYKYNEIFNLLNANKDMYQQAIATYWQSKELSLKFSNLIDFTIEELHRPYILEVNYAFIQRIYNLNKETNKNKRKEQGQILKQEMQLLSTTMTRRLLSMGERITSMNTELKK